MQRLVYTTTTHYRNEDVTASNVKNITIFVGTALIVVVGSRVKMVSLLPSAANQPTHRIKVGDNPAKNTFTPSVLTASFPVIHIDLLRRTSPCILVLSTSNGKVAFYRVAVVVSVHPL